MAVLLRQQLLSQFHPEFLCLSRQMASQTAPHFSKRKVFGHLLLQQDLGQNRIVQSSQQLLLQLQSWFSDLFLSPSCYEDLVAGEPGKR